MEMNTIRCSHRRLAKLDLKKDFLRFFFLKHEHCIEF